MVAQETNLLNAFETTLSTTLGASGTTVTLTAVTDSASNNITAPCYLVIEPDSATNREYVLVSAINIGTKTITLGDGGSSYRYLTGSSATSGLSHASGATIRYVPMAQHIEDINDRVDTIMNSAGTAVNTSGLVKDEDNMASDSATHLATQQSIKKYVDDKVTAEDLDVETDSGNIDIDLDSEALTIAGGEGIDTSATGTTVTIAGEEATTSNKGVASFSSDNFAVSSGAVTIKTGGVDNDELAGSITNAKLSNSTVSYGGVSLALGASDSTPAFDLTDATNYPTSSLSGTITNAQLAGSIANSKLSNSSITVSDGSSSTAISLGGTATFAAGEGLDVAESSGTVTFSGEDATTSNKGVASFSSDNFSVSSGAVTIKSGGVDLTAEVTGTLPTGNGGTGLSSFTAGDLVYYASGTTLTKLAKGAAGEVLTMNSGATAPEWASAAAGDITGVTAGTNLSGGGASGAVTLNLAIDSAVAFADQEASAIILKDYAETDVAVTSGATLSIDLANGNTGAVTLAHNVTDIDFTNVPTNGTATFTLKATQDGTGSRTMAINAVTVNGGSHATAKTAGGSGLTLSTGANDVDLVTFLFFDAGTPLLNALLDFS
jgi:hypothetical protein